jgi:hypothetical protein
MSVKFICPYCGESFDEWDYLYRVHIPLLHQEDFSRDELEKMLIDNDKELKFKAEQYDKVCEKMFMSCGIIEDGDSTKYLFDPEIVCNEVLKIISGNNTNREKFVLKKKEYVNMVKEGGEW